MQLTHVSGNLRQGLRRNASMHAAVVLTLFVSLSLAGLGSMLRQESGAISDNLGDQLKLVIYLCTDNDVRNPTGCDGEVTEAQKAAIEQAVQANEAPVSASPEVKSYYFESKETFKDKLVELIGDSLFTGPKPTLTLKDMPQSLWITLNDPHQYESVLSQVQGLDGFSYDRSAEEQLGTVYTIIDYLKYGSIGAALFLLIAAVLLVANTIRLNALARRKEIEIMRLVGASRIFIAFPFLLEALVTALIGIGLAAGALAAFQQWVVKRADAHFNAVPFIGWTEYGQTMVLVAIAGVVLTVLPTLLLTRKYLRI